MADGPLDGVELSVAVAGLREELQEAISAAVDEQLQFEALSVDMTFQVGVTRSGEGSGGLKFWVVELGGKAAYAAQSLQTVTLNLRPVLVDGRLVRISSDAEESPLTGESAG